MLVKGIFSFLITLFILLFVSLPFGSVENTQAPPSNAQAQPQSPSSDQQLPEVVIEGEAKDKVKIEKVTPSITIDLESMVSSSIEKTEELLQQEIEVPGKKDYQQFNSLSGDQTSHAWLPDIPEPPLITFYPKLQDVAIKNWELIVTDEQGQVIKKIIGTGSPTKLLQWDGRDQKNEVIHVGSLYSYRFVAFDKDKNQYTTPWNTFQIDALKYQENGKIYIEIANKTLFIPEKTEFQPKSMLVLKKAIDLLRENSLSPFKVTLFARSEAAPLAQSRRDLLKNTIAEELIMLPQEVTVSIDEKNKRGDVTLFLIKTK